jgi:hypothetical protein
VVVAVEVTLLVQAVTVNQVVQVVEQDKVEILLILVRQEHLGKDTVEEIQQQIKEVQVAVERQK